MYITPLTTARSSMVRLLPPRFAGGISGAMIAHSLSVRVAAVPQPDSAACCGHTERGSQAST
jgi:hypothetical protein